ncbi:NAD(P)/FAD-dependent oxidoreductase [Hyphobacterium sp.]|uniref:NAD(P)/FAD-dependent oxidoreductase n=1 Tax=Hyphobacterium sp. TaxID=2004662 RepID=UPI003BAD8673
MDTLECVVLGAGVVGLAAARAMALRGYEVAILDRGPIIGSETSSRNSEVIHAGIYYPKGSLKARACVAGKHRLYKFSEERGVPYRNCGKLIVATNAEQHERLKDIRQRAADNGVPDLEHLPREAVLEREPQLNAYSALWSPSTGIVDSHAFMLALEGEAATHGAMTILNTEIASVCKSATGTVLELTDGSAFEAKIFINAAGLFAPDIARQMGEPFASQAPQAHYAKGSYFGLATKPPFSTLIYPVPEPGGLGVHATIDLAGRVRFGPDVEWVEGINYDVDPDRAEHFYARIRDYWPGLPDGALTPDYSGIRPKISARGEPAADFRIDGPSVHGVDGVVHMFGIESPGLTASLDLADRVAQEITDRPAPAGSL